MDKINLYDFCRMFDIRVTEKVDIPVIEPPMTMIDQPAYTATAVMRKEPAVRMVISERQLVRMITMLTQKGYYHDDSYDKRMREEELILSNPDLKRMHDEYKMYLYMLCGDEWRY
jgi:hypothetical protein